MAFLDLEIDILAHHAGIAYMIRQAAAPKGAALLFSKVNLDD